MGILGDTIACVEGTPQSAQSGDRRSKQGCGCWVWGIVTAFVLYVLASIVAGPVGPVKKARQSASVQTAHALGLALYSYANDSDGHYPDGPSSTEVFQQLMDGGYVTDPEIFYLPMVGKTKAAPDQKKLRPENVCWDVTGGATSKDSPELPLVFMTGFRMTYAPGGGAVSLVDPYPLYLDTKSSPGLAVFYINDAASWLSSDTSNGPFSKSRVLPLDFDTHGKTYRQLTPDGVLR